MKNYTELLVFIRTAFSLFVARQNAIADKENRQKALNMVQDTLYKFSANQLKYLETRFDALFDLLVERYPDQANRFEHYSQNRYALNSAVYISFTGSFFAVNVHQVSELKYMTNAETMVMHFDTMNLPYDALLMCQKHHRETVKALASLEVV